MWSLVAYLPSKHIQSIATSRPNLYDWLKIIAIITMIIDHVWLIFFPEQITRRIIWRTAFPIFLFLVWFNYFYERNTKLWVRWALLQAFLRWWRLLWATSIVYLNILIAIGLVRIILGYLKRIDTVRVECIVCIVSIMLIPYSLSIIDYGTDRKSVV